MENFLRVANTVHTNLKTKYHDGEFIDPADPDPKAEAEKAAAALKAWKNLGLWGSKDAETSILVSS